MDKAVYDMLLNGLDIDVGGITIRNYTLRDIFNVIKLDNYNRKISLTVLQPDDLGLKDILDEQTIKSMSMYDMSCSFIDIREFFLDFLNTFTYHNWYFNDVFNEYVCSLGENKRLIINRKNIDNILETARKMYCVPKRKERVQTSSEIESILKEFEEFDKKTKYNKKQGGITLDSIILAVSTRHHTYNLFNIWDLTVFQLLETYRQLEKDDNWHYTMTGAYAGTIDTKQIDMSKIHWANRHSKE